MKGLERLPTESELQEAYEGLQGGLGRVTPGMIALWSQWSRFDPRLAEQWVEYLMRSWRELSPIELHIELARYPWPAACGALLEQVKEFGGEFGDWTSEDPSLFDGWFRCVMAGFEPAAGEQFFIGLRALGGTAMREDAAFSFSSYLRWGYLGREVLLNKARSRVRSKTLVPPQARRVALDDLVRQRATSAHPWLTIRDYREALGGWVSPRQAEYDLSAHPRLRARGRTRARVYRIVGK